MHSKIVKAMLPLLIKKEPTLHYSRTIGTQAESGPKKKQKMMTVEPSINIMPCNRWSRQ